MPFYNRDKMNNSFRVLISGGGTGGHIFPAISIANAIREICADADILFVGALGRMEMTRVPQAGYRIVGLPVRGLIRPLYSLRNISVMADFVKSRRMVRRLLREFCPQVVVGVGGYASAPTLSAAHSMGIPCLIQEQNSFAGVANRSLAGKVSRICVAYEGMERFFPAEKICLTGNPVRQSLLGGSLTKAEAARQFGLDGDRPLILIVGGSLGARTINESVLSSLRLIEESKVNFLWQTGSYYLKAIEAEMERVGCPSNLVFTEFVADMAAAYRAADLVVSRAGASSISELCLLGKPSILVPSPNVAEDHQTHNAMALVNRDAALIVRDAEAKEKLIPLAIRTVADKSQLESLGNNAKLMALPDAADRIAREVIELAKMNGKDK